MAWHPVSQACLQILYLFLIDIRGLKLMKIRKGKLTKWKDERGFGFIRPQDGSQEVFLHISDIKDLARRPQEGDIIYYHVVTENGKMRACNASIVGAKSKRGSSSKAKRKYPFPTWEVLLLSILPLTGAIHFALITTNPIPLMLYLVMSLVTFALYAEDKSRAKRGKWRISEQTLHLCEFAGGWLGGFIAQRKLRHKSIKSSYQIVFWAIVVIHTAFWIVFWIDWLFLDETIIKVLFEVLSV